MSPKISPSVTISSLAKGSVFNYALPLWVHSWNNNSKYASLSQSRATEQDHFHSHLTGYSFPSTEMKICSDLAHDSVSKTEQLLSPEQKTSALYLEPTHLNCLLSQRNTDKDSLRLQSLGTNGQENIVNTSNRQDTPSTLNLWSSTREERPSYSKFTLGLSPSIFSSFLFPQQVTYEKHKNPHTSSHSLKYSNVRRDDFNTRIRSSASTTDKPDYFYTSTRSSTSSHDDNEDPDTSFGSVSSLHDENEYPETFRRSSTSSCDEEETGFSPTVHYHVDSSTLFGDLNPTPPPPAPRERQLKKVIRRPPTSSSDTARQQTAPLRADRREKQRTQFRQERYFVKYNKALMADTPRKAKPESAYLSDFYSPYRDHSPRATPTPQPTFREDDSPSSPKSSPYSLDDMSPSDSPGSASDGESPASTRRGACRGIKPPCFKLGTEFGEEPPDSMRVQSITDREFYHFINDNMKVAVMFYFGDLITPDFLKVWDRQAREKSLWGVEAYGSVDCNTERELCAREYIASNPVFKIYVGGFATNAGKHFKV